MLILLAITVLVLAVKLLIVLSKVWLKLAAFVFSVLMALIILLDLIII